MMDKIKIGKFITMCRKDKRITQEQLAEILGVTSKSVSKWENGICLPDALLYEPLCTALEITINELFAGHRIKDEDYKRIADENLMQMLKYKLYSLSNKDIPCSVPRATSSSTVSYPTGDAVITSVFRLKAKHVIHAVGPIWVGGKNNEQEWLYICYERSLRLAKLNGCHSIAFPLVLSCERVHLIDDFGGW